jgi:hypothetical protein
LKLTVVASALTCAVLVINIPSNVVAQSRSSDTVTLVACVVREADFARSAASDPAASAETQLLLANAQSGTPTYSLTGLRERDLTSHVGQRVEISGTVERPRTTPVVTTADGSRAGVVSGDRGATGVTPDGAAAHEPSDALAATVKAGQAAQPSARVADPVYRVAMLPRLNATSYRRVAGGCNMPKPVAATPSAESSQARDGSAPLLASQSVRPPESIVARGCLVRRTAGGTALTPADGQVDPLVLANAALVGQQPVAPAGVPGSTAAGNGSGTVPTPVGTSGSTPQDAARLSLALDIDDSRQRELSRLVGERVEIVGEIAGEGARSRGESQSASDAGASAGVTGRVEPRADAAHPSVPARAIRVTSFRAVGGACN